MRLAALVLLLIVCMNLFAAPQSLYPFTSPQEQQRFLEITQETRCVVCQNQSLAESSAPLAKDIREKIYHLVLAKKTNAEIHHYLLQRYGEFISLRPLLNKTNLVLWLFPFITLTIFFLWLFKSSGWLLRSGQNIRKIP